MHLLSRCSCFPSTSVQGDFNPVQCGENLTVFFCSCVCFCLYGPFNCISFEKIIPTTLLFFSLFFWSFSAFLVVSTIYLFVKVSLSPDIILCGWLGLKHQLTNWPWQEREKLKTKCGFEEGSSLWRRRNPCFSDQIVRTSCGCPSKITSRSSLSHSLAPM